MVDLGKNQVEKQKQVELRNSTIEGEKVFKTHGKQKKKW